MDNQELGDIFSDDEQRYEQEKEDQIEDGRKNDVIKDEDTEDDDSGGENGKKSRKNKNDVQEKKKAKRKSELTREKGIKCLYENLDRIKLFANNEKGIFDEMKALDKLVKYYKEWHFHFMPKYDYKYFLDRCSEFGKQTLMKTYMPNVRKVHKGELQWADLATEEQNENLQGDNNGNQNQAAPGNQQNAQNNAQPNNRQNQNISINDTNVSRTIDVSKIPKQLKDTYLPSSQIKRNPINDSTFTKSNDNSRIPVQSQDSQISNKNNKSKKTQIYDDSEDYQNYEKDDEDYQMQKYLDMEEELKLLNEQFNVEENKFQEDRFCYDDDEDDDDIKIKKIQKD